MALTAPSQIEVFGFKHAKRFAAVLCLLWFAVAGSSLAAAPQIQNQTNVQSNAQTDVRTNLDANSSASVPPHALLELSSADYLDRVQAIWTAQMIAQLTGLRFEHKVASAVPVTPISHPPGYAPVDDDYYYEMVAVRAFEKYGPGLTVAQLGEQWLKNNAGSWGSSEQALLLLKRGIKPPDTGHPRYNKLWWTIGPEFSSDLYGILAPGMPNLAGNLARELGHINGYAEGTDGGVFIAGMISIAFAERDPHQIVRQAASLIAPQSPYRQSIDMVISLAERGNGPEQICRALARRWGIEYPATNNAVLNGGIVAVAVWFGEGDFQKTLQLAVHAADFSDADCNAANSASVVAAMYGMKALPAEQVAELHDRILGAQMGDLRLTPPVDESISSLARRTAAIGEAILVSHGASLQNDTLRIPSQQPVTQPAELFELADLMRYWNPQWTLERAGFGGAGGGLPGIRGITFLDGDVLATYPRDEIRGTMLRRSAKLNSHPTLAFQAGVDPGRAWQLQVYVNDERVLDTLVLGTLPQRRWKTFRLNLSKYAQQEVVLRLYQLVLIPHHEAGNAYWRQLVLE